MFNYRQHEKTLYQVRLSNDLIDEIEELLKAIRPTEKSRVKTQFVEYLLREGIKNYREQQNK